MGRRGPPPQTRDQRILNGNPSGASLPIDIEFDPSFPQRPAGLNPYGNQVYDWLKKASEKSGLFKASDALSIEILCHAYQDYKGAMVTAELVSKHHSLESFRKAARMHLLELLKEHGLTPNSRARLGAARTPDTAAGSAFEKFLNKGTKH